MLFSFLSDDGSLKTSGLFVLIYGDIKSVSNDPEGNIMFGVDFEGNSSRKDEMKRFYDVLNPMESEYKSKLI